MICRHYGKELTGSPESRPNCGATLTSSTTVCPRCGAPTTALTEAYKVCTKWGRRVAGKAVAGGGAWMPVTAGILDLAIGAFGVGWHLTVRVFGPAVIIDVVIAMIAIVGGVFALRKRAWGLALAGSICAFLTLISPIWPAIVFGIPAIVFTALGRKHFKYGAYID